MPSRSTTPFIGRAHQLTALAAAAGDAAAGQPRVVLVEGEAGAGKTRMLRQWLAATREDAAGGFVTALATCVDLKGGALPYGPVAQLLRALARDLGHDVFAGIARHAPAELRCLLPATYRPAESPAGSGTASPAGSPTGSPTGSPAGSATGSPDEPAAVADVATAPRGRLVESLLDLLDQASRVRPLVLCVDDLQWADEDSLDALRFIARSASTEPILLVLAYRSEEIARLNPARGELIRGPGAEVVTVPPFTADEVAAHVAALLGSAPQQGDVALLRERTAGNPFFVEELVRGDGWRSGRAPDTLRGLLAERIARTSGPAQRLLRFMAVAGRPCTYPELSGTAAFSAAELDTALSEALAAHLIDEDDGWQRFRFRHPLVGEVLAAGCAPHARRSAHLALGRSLQGLAGADPAELARHWDGAGEIGPALQAHVRAADQAVRVAGYAQAWQHWRRAVQLCSATTDGPSLIGLDEATLRCRAAESARWAGAPGEAVELLRAIPAGRGTDRGTGVEQRAVVLDLLARCLREAGQGRDSTTAAEQAAELLTGHGNAPVRARALAGLAAAHLVRSRYREAIDAARTAIQVADATGATAVSGHASNTLGVALVMCGDTTDGLAALQRAGRIAEEHGDLEDRLRAANNLSYAYMNSGRYRDAFDTAIAGYRVARRHGLAATGGALLVTNASTALVWLGEWSEADALAAEGLAEVNADGLAAALHLTRAEVAVATGDRAAAELHVRHAEQTAAGLDEPQIIGHLCACRAELALWLGDPAAGVEAIRAGLSAAGEGEDDQLALRLAALGLRAAADAAETAAITRRPVEDTDAVMWRELVEKLANGTDSGAFPEAHADALTARAELSRLDAAPPSTSAELWSAAAGRWSGLSRPYPAAYCHWRAAQALLGAGNSKAAAEALRTAHRIAGELGAAPLLAEVDALARSRRIGLQGRVLPASSHPAGLTAREREVLDLLTDGLTNRQIARRLLMSEKTASVHVSHIMTKLGVPTRGAAAAAARRLPATP